MMEQYTLNDGHIVEALDRIHVAQCFIEMSLDDHALIDAVPDFSAGLEDIHKRLHQLYQLIGRYDTVQEIATNHAVKPRYSLGAHTSWKSTDSE